jgi:Mg2+ and Co2+ transporter CorA
MREALIAWQETSKNGKYYVLFASGKIDVLDEDEMESRGATVGKHLAASEKATQNDIRERLKEEEDDWAQTKKMFEEDERKEDAFEKELQKPDQNPANEAVRKMNLPHEMKALVQRRQARRADLEVKRKVYEQQKKRLEEQLSK